MANPLKFLLPVALLLVLSACAVREPVMSWPAELPPRAYFEQQWRADPTNRALQEQDDYLLWITRFYEGFNMVPGWLDMMEQVRERIPAARWRAVQPRLWQLGQRIGSEWAKDNEVRKLNTRSAAVWRDALLEALSQDDLEHYLDRLDADVSALLNGELDNSSIRFERYYVDEFDF